MSKETTNNNKFKCNRCGFELEIRDAKSLNKMSIHIDTCTNKDLNFFIFLFQSKIKKVKLTSSEIESICDLYNGN